MRMLLLSAGALMTCPCSAVAGQVSGSAQAERSAEGLATPTQNNSALAAPAADPSTAAPGCCIIPALTPVELEIVTPAHSKTSRQGQEIQIRLVEPILVDGKTVVPAGTMGGAVVVQASPGGLGGKAGELVIGLPYLQLGSIRLGLKRLRYGAGTGKGRDTAVLVGMAAIGPVGALISGGSVEIKSGTRANAVVSGDTVIPVAEQ